MALVLFLFLNAPLYPQLLLSVLSYTSAFPVTYISQKIRFFTYWTFSCSVSCTNYSFIPTYSYNSAFFSQTWNLWRGSSFANIQTVHTFCPLFSFPIAVNCYSFKSFQRITGTTIFKASVLPKINILSVLVLQLICWSRNNLPDCGCVYQTLFPRSLAALKVNGCQARCSSWVSWYVRWWICITCGEPLLIIISPTSKGK